MRLIDISIPLLTFEFNTSLNQEEFLSKFSYFIEDIDIQIDKFIPFFKKQDKNIKNTFLWLLCIYVDLTQIHRYDHWENVNDFRLSYIYKLLYLDKKNNNEFHNYLKDNKNNIIKKFKESAFVNKLPNDFPDTPIDIFRDNISSLTKIIKIIDDDKEKIEDDKEKKEKKVSERYFAGEILLVYYYCCLLRHQEIRMDDSYIEELRKNLRRLKKLNHIQEINNEINKENIKLFIKAYPYKLSDAEERRIYIKCKLDQNMDLQKEINSMSIKTITNKHKLRSKIMYIFEKSVNCLSMIKYQSLTNKTLKYARNPGCLLITEKTIVKVKKIVGSHLINESCEKNLLNTYIKQETNLKIAIEQFNADESDTTIDRICEAFINHAELNRHARAKFWYSFMIKSLSYMFLPVLFIFNIYVMIYILSK